MGPLELLTCALQTVAVDHTLRKWSSRLALEYVLAWLAGLAALDSASWMEVFQHMGIKRKGWRAWSLHQTPTVREYRLPT